MLSGWSTAPARRTVTFVPPWKSVTLGEKESGRDYRHALAAAGVRTDGRTADFLDSTTFACTTVPAIADLVLVSVADLGFTEGATYRQISTHAYESGVDLCSEEVGPALRLAYLDQSDGERIVIGMQAIEDADGGPMLFCLEQGGEGPSLKALNGPPGRFWCPNTRFVFLRSA